MKKIISASLFMICVSIAQAQFKGGATLLYGSGIESLGMGVKSTYGINEKIAASGEINYFFGKSESGGGFKASTSLLTIDADAHYYFDEGAEKLNFYGIGGLNLSIIKSEVDFSGAGFPSGFGGSGSATEVGLNIGAGFLYPLNDTLELVTEASYTISTFDQFVAQVGVLYTFKNK